MLIRTLALPLMLAVPALAQTTDHSGHGMAGASDTPATQAFRAGNHKIHANLAIEDTGNADVDFIRGMIAHQQGAVDAARVVLEHGADPEVRAFAEGVIAAQEAEIAWINAWLAANAP